MLVFPADPCTVWSECPARAGIPLWWWGRTPTFRTLTSAVWVLPEQAHNHLKSTSKEGYTSIRVSHRLLSFQNNTTYSIRLVLLDLYGFPITRRTIHMTHFSHNYNTSDLLENPRETAYLHVSPQGSPPIWREWPTADPQRRAVSRRPRSTYREPYTQNTYPHHCGPYKLPT